MKKRRGKFLILDRVKSQIELLKATNHAPVMSARARNAKGQFGPGTPTILMRIWVGDAYEIIKTAQRKGLSCAQVVHTRDWSAE